jgi:site-specific recombinase XerD
MIRVLELHRKSPHTIKAYLRAVEQLAQFYRRSPEQLSDEQIRDFIHYLITERKLSWSSCNQRLAGINFLFRHVLAREGFHLKIPHKRSGKLPEPLGRSEISQLLAVAKNLKHRALLMTTYGGGLRVGELVRLKPQDIHSQRMLIRVNQGKGRKDRYTLLSPRLLQELRAYWVAYRPTTWLFTNQHDDGPLPESTAQQMFYDLKRRAGITHGLGIHCLRHSFATHLMEAGVPLPAIQKLMGHKSLMTTAKYLHVTAKHIDGIGSPLELLRLPGEDDLR